MNHLACSIFYGFHNIMDVRLCRNSYRINRRDLSFFSYTKAYSEQVYM